MIARSLRLLAASIAVALLISVPVAAARPSVVLIQTDDQTLEQLYAQDAIGHPIMPNVLSRIARDGVSFDRYYVTYPICCPSRTSLLTGRYVHNHGVLINAAPYGYTAFKDSPAFNYNLATWLQGAGYRTIHVGKFLNFYGDADPTEIPPGWSDWETIVSDEGARRYYGYTLNINGSLLGPLGDWEGNTVDPLSCTISAPGTASACNYSTDVDTALAVNAIQRAAADPEPFYLQVDYTAPHVDLIGADGPDPAPRDAGTAAGVRYRPQSFDEHDISDKPRFIRLFHRLAPARQRDIDGRYDLEVESLRDVDRGVGMILDELAATGRLDNTYVFFVSDNGQFHGEHRIAQGKYLPYEPAAHMPLLMRGPGLLPGSHSPALVANIDIAPTIAALAGVSARVDGRSLLPFAEDPGKNSRRPILLEGYALGGTGRFDHHNAAPVLDYFGVVAGPYKYIRYGYGDRELYDLERDPEEMRSLVSDPAYRATVSWAQSLTNRLKVCRYSGCRIDSHPPPAPGTSALGLGR